MKMPRTSRRTFILGMTGVGALAAAGLQGSDAPEATAAPLPSVTTPPPLARSTWQAMPRWRGFNLLERFDRDNPEFNRDFDIWDLDAMAEWGFDFVRVPLDYRIWTRDDGSIDDGPLKSIDALVWEANARGIHVNLSMHRASSSSRSGGCCRSASTGLMRQSFRSDW
jgi:Cellulase (glycosyl hydrolase family 5)